MAKCLRRWLATATCGLAATAFAARAPVTINFDSVDASTAGVGGTAVTNYLAGYGISVSDMTAGTDLQIQDERWIYSGQAIQAPSPHNVITQTGVAAPISFTLHFRSLVSNVGFTRAGLIAGPSGVTHPAWSVTALDAHGAVIGFVQEGYTSSFVNVAPAFFSLPYDGIAALRISSDGSGKAGFDGLVFDDLTFTPTAQFFGVGQLPGSQAFSSEIRDAFATPNGVIAVGSAQMRSTSGANDTAVRWSETGGLAALPDIVTNTTGQSFITASAITGDGNHIIGRSRSAATGNARVATTWAIDGSSPTSLGFLTTGVNFSAANGASSDGSVLYGFGDNGVSVTVAGNPVHEWEAFRWNASTSTMTHLGFLNTGDVYNVPAARAVSSDGSIMVGTSGSSGGPGPGNRAYYYDGTAMHPLLLGTGGTWSAALALSQDGTIAQGVGDTTAHPGGELLQWRGLASVPTALGVPNPAWVPSNLAGMTDDGEVAVIGFGPPDPMAYGLAYVRNSTGWFNLQAILAGTGADLTGWTITDALGMSHDGTLVWGAGWHNGVREGWVASFAMGYLAAIHNVALVNRVAVIKIHTVEQTGDTAVADAATSPWNLDASVEGSGFTVSDPAGPNQLQMPSGSTVSNAVIGLVDDGNLDFNTDQNGGYATKDALNAAFANGTYGVVVGSNNLSLGLTGDLYPDSPRATFSGGSWQSGVLVFDPTQPLTISTAFGSTNYLAGQSYLEVDVKDTNWEQNNFSDLTTSSLALSIPANTLTPGQTYTVVLHAMRAATLDNTSLPGAQAVAGYAVETRIQIRAASAAAVPVISSFSPSTVGPGQTLTILGSGFTGATAVSFGTQPASSFTVVSDTQISAVVPSGAVSGPISVTTAAGTAMSSSSLAVTTGPAAQFWGVGQVMGSTAPMSEIRDVAETSTGLVGVGGARLRSTSGNEDTAVRWTPMGGLSALPNVVSNNTAGSFIVASAITPSGGLIIGRSRDNATGGLRVATTWSGDGSNPVSLGLLPGSTNFDAAIGASADGSVIYGFGIDSAGKTEPFRYAGGTLTPLGFLNAGDAANFPTARAVSTDGSVMVGTSGSTGSLGAGNHAYRYVFASGTGTMTALPNLTGGTWTLALALTPDGTKVLGLGDSTAVPNGELAIWDYTSGTTPVVTPLGSPNPGWGPSNFGGMSSDGQVAVITYGDPNDPNNPGLPYLRNSHGWFDLNNVLRHAGANLSNWQLNGVFGMSADGTVVWGAGSHWGMQEGWVAALPPGFLAGVQGAAEYSLLGVSKVHVSTQTDATTVVDAANAPWQLQASIEGSGFTVSDPASPNSVTAPSGSTTASVVIPLQRSDSLRYSFDTAPTDAFTSRAALDAAFANGTYTLQTGGQSAAISVTGDSYPDVPVAAINGGTWNAGVLTLDTNQPLSITQNYGTNNYEAGRSYLDVKINGTPFDADSGDTLNVSQITLNVSPGSLMPGQTYAVKLDKVHATTFSTGPAGFAPNVTVAGGYETITTFNLQVTGIRFNSQPMDLAVAVGNGASFNTSVTATGTVTYQWQKNGVPISGATNASLALTNVQSADAALYSVVVNNGTVSATSNAAVLTVNPTGSAPYQNGYMLSQSTVVGGSVSFSVPLQGTTPFTYQWRHNGFDIAGATNATLTLSNVQFADAGSYSLRVNNSAGSCVIGPVQLTVASAAPANDAFANAAVIASTGGRMGGGNVGASLEPGEPDHSGYNQGMIVGGHSVWWTWTAPSTGVMSVDTSGSGIDTLLAVYTGTAVNALTRVGGAAGYGSKGAALTFYATAGTTYAIAIDGYYGETGPVVLNLAPGTAMAPALQWSPYSQTVTAGGNTTLDVGVAGTFPVTYQWQKNGSNIAGATKSSLTFTNVQSSDAGTYQVVVTNGAGSVTSGSATLTVTAPVSGPPMITAVSPVGAAAGTTVTITGSGLATVNGVSFNGVAAASFTVVSDTQVTAVAPTGYAGGTISVQTASGALATTAPLTVVNQPVARRVAAGGTVVWRIGTTGTGPFTYQWSKDGSALVGQTNATLQLSRLSSANAGSYTVTVTSATGAVTTVGASLTVLADDPVLWQQFTTNSQEQAPVHSVDIGGYLYVPWSIYDRLPDVAGGRFVGGLARFSETDGTLDSTFRLDPKYYSAAHVAVQSSGKLIIAVNSGDTCTVIRTTATGTTDTTFNAPFFAHAIRFVTVQSDDKVLVAATDNPNPYAPAGALAKAGPSVYRLNSDGSIDLTFSPAVMPEFSPLFAAPAVDGNGKIYLAGAFSAINNVARINIARLNADGTLDTYADPATLPAGFSSQQARAVLIQSDGRAVFAGGFWWSTRGSSTNQVVAIRFSTTGAFDTNFGMPLRNDLQLSGPRFRAAVLNPDDTIVGVSDRLVRLTKDGAVDTSFNSPSMGGEGFWLSRAGDGSLFVPNVFDAPGQMTTQSFVGNGVAKFGATGASIQTFQTGGWGRVDYPTDGAVLSDGRVWVAGVFNRYGGLAVPGIAQFGTNGGPTTSQVLSTRSMTWATLAPTANDAVFAILGAPYDANDTTPPTLVRVQSSGSIDSTFTPVLPTGYDLYSTSLHAAPNGGVILAQASITAQAALNGNTGDALFLLNSTGSRETTYTATLTSVASVQRDASNHVTMITTGGLNVAQVLPDGRALVVVSAIDGSLRLVRLTAMGSVDTTFNAPSFGTIAPQSGYTGSITDPVSGVTSQFPITSYSPADLIRTAFQMADGHVYVGGRLSLGGSPRGLVRLNADGSIDTSFTGVGIANSNIAAGPYVDALTVDGSGRLYVGGCFDSFNGTAVPGIFRLAADGTLDTTWSPGFSVLQTPHTAVRLVNTGTKLYAFGTVGSAGDTLPAIFRIADLSSAVVITQQPQPQTANQGTMVTFSVTATGTPAPTYQWQKNGTPIAGATNSTLVFSSVQSTDEGTYVVVVSNSSGSVTSNPVGLAVRIPPTITTQPQSQTVNAGTTVSFSVAATGSPTPVYQWRKDGLNISNATNPTLTIASVQSGDAGTYTVIVTNAANSVLSNAATLTVNAAATAPSITTQPVSQTATVGANVTFSVAATGSPAPTYQWLKNGATLSGATNATLALSNVQTGDSATYAVVVTNSASSITSSPATLTVNAPTTGGTASLAVVGSPVYTTTGGSVTLQANVTYTGQTPNTVAFTVNLPSGWSYGALAGGSAPSSTPSSGATGTLTFAYGTPFPTDQAGFMFTATYPAGLSGAQSIAGSATLDTQTLAVPSVVLTQVGPPTITSQPAGTTAVVGANVTFSVTANSSGSLTYQWQKDGAAVAGGSNASLTLSNVQLTDAGNYTVTVSNIAGPVTSSSASLTVFDVSATHAVVGAGYISGGTLTVTNTLTYSGVSDGPGWQVLLPPGWSFASGTTVSGMVSPAVGTTDLLEWAWTTSPPSPITFTYTVNVPAGTTGDQNLSALVIFRQNGQYVQFLAKPDPLVVHQVTTHSADENQDFKISLLELTRVIELYNTRNGTTRTGCYVVQAGTEDGFASDPTRLSTASVTLTSYHSADENHDGKIDLLELTRVIELYNYRAGTTRTGQYHVQAGTEDGFAPGP